MVGDEVRVTRSEAAVENDLLVSLTVTIGVTQPDDVRLADGDDAVLIMTEAGDQLEAFVEDLLLVKDSVVLAGRQYADLVLRRAIIATGNQHAAFAPRFSGERTTSVRVLGGLGHPQATAFIPLDGDGLIDQGLGRDDAGLETGLHLESGDGLGGAAGSADRVPHIHEVLRGAEFVDIGASGRPGDATLDEGAVAGMRERLGLTLQEDRRTEAGILEHPGLRLNIIDGSFVRNLDDVLAIGADLRGEGRGEYLDLLVEIELEHGLVRDVERRSVFGQGMGIGADV